MANHGDSEKAGEHYRLASNKPGTPGFLDQTVDFSDRNTQSNDYYPAPIVGKGSAWGSQPQLRSNELTAAYRINRDILLKASYYTRQPYGQLTWDHQAAVQAVFQHRWW